MAGLVFLIIIFFNKSNRNHVKLVLESQYLNFLYLFVFLAYLIMLVFLWSKSVIEFNFYNLVDN